MGKGLRSVEARLFVCVLQGLLIRALGHQCGEARGI